jgi:acyl-CoA hydrolase
MEIRYQTAASAVTAIESGNRIFVQGSAATPLHLLRAMINRRHELKDVELVSISTMGDGIFDVPDFSKSFFVNSLFVSESTRSIVNSNDGEYIPIFLSEIPLLFERNLLPIDIALVHVSPPDKHGFCSLGTSVDITRSAIKHAKHVIAQVNHRMPRTHGDGIIHIKEINEMVNIDEALPEVNYKKEVNEAMMTIGQYCAELIDDRSTLQMGIGGIPDAVLSCLHNHKDLGVHTEMFSDGVVELVEKGVITNEYKKKHPGKIVTGFAIGTRKLYDFIDDNPQVVFLDIQYVNNPRNIASNPKAVAINSAIEIDITGQVCSDSIGTYQYSGVGGQMDFIRGAALSDGGKPIIAMTSTTKKGASKIVPYLQQGAGVVTTRAHAHYVITEYGVAYLFGKNLKQRAKALVEIAHPDHREWLDRVVVERFGK